MNIWKVVRSLVAGVAVSVMVAGCSTSSKSPEVSDKIRKDLKDANFGDVSVSQDRDKGVVTLGGHHDQRACVARYRNTTQRTLHRTTDLEPPSLREGPRYR